MSMIFPGMDPYLENPQVWPGVHARLIVYLADQLQLLLRPRYVAKVEERVYVEGADHQYIPGVLIKQSARPQRSGGAAVAEVEEPLVSSRPVRRFTNLMSRSSICPRRRSLQLSRFSARQTSSPVRVAIHIWRSSDMPSGAVPTWSKSTCFASGPMCWPFRTD